MSRSILVVDAVSEERRDLCAILEQSDFRAIPLRSLAELLETIQERPCHAVVLDFDSLPLDNSFIRELRQLNPVMCMIGMSNRTFHPELEEAIRTHISACLSKPVKVDELIYWLKSVCNAGPGSRASPAEE